MVWNIYKMEMTLLFIKYKGAIMGNYTVFAEVSTTIITLLRNVITPEPFNKPEQIGICSPREKENYEIGVFLYDIEIHKEMELQSRIIIDETQYKEPPLSFSLYYMIFVNLKSDSSTKQIDEQRILGKIIQQLYNYRKIPQQYLSGSIQKAQENISLQYLNVSLEEKNKLYAMWNFYNETACFYKVSPVFMDTEMIHTTKRIVKREFKIQQKQKGEKYGNSSNSRNNV